VIVAEDPMDGSPWQGRYLYDSQAIWPRHNDTPPGEGRLTEEAYDAAGRVEGGLGRAEPVGRGVVGFLGVLAGGVGLLQRRLCGGQPAAQL